MVKLKCKYCDTSIEEESQVAWKKLKHHFRTTHPVELKGIVARIELETGGKPPIDTTGSREKREIPFSALSRKQRREIGLDDDGDD